MREARRLHVFWLRDGARVTAERALRLMKAGRWPAEAGRLHHVHGLIEANCLRRPVVMVRKGVVLDGNHTLLALIESGYRGQVLLAEARGKSERAGRTS